MTEGIIDALAIARAEFERRLTAITDDGWGRPTPCTEWNVSQLVNHIVGHEYRYADNLATNNSEYYVASRDDDFLGDDPHGSWPRGVALLDEAIAGLDSLDTTISFLLPLPARDVLLVRVFEAAVHTWDVSRAIGFDERIDERLAMLTLCVPKTVSVQVRCMTSASPRFGLPSPWTGWERLRRGGRRGMMCDCAVATGLLDSDERVRGAAPSFRERSGQGRRDLGLAPSGRGAGAPAGREEGAPYACGPGVAGGAAAPAGATGPWPDAVAGTPRYGAALAS